MRDRNGRDCGHAQPMLEARNRQVAIGAVMVDLAVPKIASSSALVLASVPLAG